MGGWYLQPDCNMPNGESMIRNIMEGKMFFKEHFNRTPTTAINFDSFGHSRGLVQILEKAGYDSYLVFRPDINNYDFDDSDFIWKGFADSYVIVHRSDEGYNSVWGKAKEELEELIKTKEEDVTLFLWGVGNHGGGPTRKDLTDLSTKLEHEKYNIIHSTPEDYFEELRSFDRELPVVERGLNPVAPGCYTSQIRVKQKHRLLENEIYSAEKMATAASVLYDRPYDRKVFKEVIKALLFAEFHDALSGTGTKQVEEDTIRILNYGLEIMSREKMDSFISLASGEPKVIDGSSTIMFYNPHPYDICGVFECELSLPNQNWTTNFMYPKVYINGERIPTQAEKEDSNFALDWRKKVVVQANLKASSMNRMDVFFDPIEERPKFDEIVSKKYYTFDNEEMEVKINTTTGLIDEYVVDGVNYLDKNSFSLIMFDDTSNPWGIKSAKSHGKRSFQLATLHEAGEFSGLTNKVVPAIRIIEDGEVRTIVETIFSINNSNAYIRYNLPKKGTSFDVDVLVNFEEKEQYLKLMLNPASGKNSRYEGQIMFGREDLTKGDAETVSQKWVMISDDKSKNSIAVVNDSIHGSSFEDGALGLTLLRSAGYTAAHSVMGAPLQEEQWAPRMEQGEREFSFRIYAGETKELSSTIDNLALAFNEKPYGVAYCPPGTGEKRGSFISIDNKAVILSALKRAEKRDGYIMRLYESEGKNQKAIVYIPSLEIDIKIQLNPNEIKTFYIDTINNSITDTTIIEGI